MRMLIVCVMVVLTYSVCGSKAVLQTTAQGVFKISQFTDLHFGEAENLSWGPTQDRNSLIVMNKMISYEQPDLVVFTGDQITGNNVRDNATAIWDQMLTPLLNTNTKWAAVMGNHDDLVWEQMQQKHKPLKSTTGRDELYSHDISYEQSYTRKQFKSQKCGGGNDYYQLVYSSSNSSKALMILWFLDSGGGTIQENVCTDSIQWLLDTADQLQQQHGQLKQMLFMHIPLWQYIGIFSNDNPNCSGMNANGGITPTTSDTGLYSAILQAGIDWVVVGHNHGNDWCCHDEASKWLCFGRHTGYGGYGHWSRGSRIYQYDEHTNSINSWVRMEDGSIIHSTH